MTGININAQEAIGQNIQLEGDSVSNRISNLPMIISFALKRHS